MWYGSWVVRSDKFRRVQAELTGKIAEVVEFFNEIRKKSYFESFMSLKLYAFAKEFAKEEVYMELVVTLEELLM
jgi:hypothetical protein